ncbi:HCL358Wp [Eremothecium sinecaudum]|uniref:RNA helicase n=1 Tax=Eremothecium sinecaudum TaxID=45286 RepID=A0A109UYH8_9SACH|nr:HCL358Wp [Eremothecium sinecaudum]AMD19793.1 HCL358Wp [Eremothecium sinecaudum]
MRPKDIYSLLGENSKGTNDELDSPKFLNIHSRHTLLRNKATINNNATVKSTKKRGAHDLDDSESDELKTGEVANAQVENLVEKKAKFQFGWDDSDDTFSNFKPVSSIRAKDLIKNKVDVVENSYMDRHWSQKSLDEMNSRDWRILSEDYGIKTKGSRLRHPLRNWEEGLIPKDILHVIHNQLGFKEPTAIQRVTIPNVQDNRDFMGIAATGSGKTLAFLIPIFAKLAKLPVSNVVTRADGPSALILAPTRELAQQIEAEAKMLASYLKWPCAIASIVGGHSLEDIRYRLRDGCDILTATPGRLIDCLENHLIVLRRVSTLVLDEADRMVDFGFEDQLTSILARTDTIPGRQTLMFSATMSNVIEKIANGYLRDPAYATIGDIHAAPQIQQIIDYIPGEDERFQKMCKDILPNFKPPIIIFINYKSTADWLSQKFQTQTKFRTTTLHGSKSQVQREHSINQLREGKVDIMIATNVAGRGIDIPNVSLVLNFEMATKLEEYIHRIGRTGRANNVGTAITFLTSKDNAANVEALCKYVTKNDVTGRNLIDRKVKLEFKIEDKSKESLIY